MIRRSLKMLALTSALALVVGAVFGGKAAGFFQHEHSGSVNASSIATVKSERKVLYWYDAMNPQQTYDKPGKALDGMDLVPKYAGAENGAMSNLAVGTIKIPPQKQELIGVRTATVQRESLVRLVRTTGQITADETKIAHVHVKIS